MSDDRYVYLDSSAIAKLILVEPGSRALERHLEGRPRRASSSLARVEVLRRAGRLGREAVIAAHAVLAAIELADLDDAVLQMASRLEPPTLRTLDALHVATALLMGSALESIVTYDARMAEAARANGLTVVAPS